jgi:hypothetical protein
MAPSYRWCQNVINHPNKFSLKSGEYAFPLYGWLPNSLRYKLRIAGQGPFNSSKVRPDDLLIFTCLSDFMSLRT